MISLIFRVCRESVTSLMIDDFQVINQTTTIKKPLVKRRKNQCKILRRVSY